MDHLAAAKLIRDGLPCPEGFCSLLFRNPPMRVVLIAAMVLFTDNVTAVTRTVHPHRLMANAGREGSANRLNMTVARHHEGREVGTGDGRAVPVAACACELILAYLACPPGSASEFETCAALLLAARRRVTLLCGALTRRCPVRRHRLVTGGAASTAT